MIDSITSTGGRRQRKREQTASHLAATAFRLFETHGYDMVSMELIADEADVAKATLYNYFQVKEALLAHCFREDIGVGYKVGQSLDRHTVATLISTISLSVI